MFLFVISPRSSLHRDTLFLHVDLSRSRIYASAYKIAWPPPFLLSHFGGGRLSVLFSEHERKGFMRVTAKASLVAGAILLGSMIFGIASEEIEQSLRPLQNEPRKRGPF